jgi:hypothetical protein
MNEEGAARRLPFVGRRRVTSNAAVRSMDMPSIAIVLSLVLTASAALANHDLTGVVVDSRSVPLKDAHVYIYTATPRTGISPVCPSCYRDCGKRETAGAGGAFRIRDLDAKLLFDVLAVADGYEPVFTYKVDPARGPVTITLRERSAADAERLITGVVVDGKRKPVVGALVEPNGYRAGRSVGYGNIPGIDKLSITNRKGEFALRIPDASSKLDVRVTARDLAPYIERMLAPGERRVIELSEGAAISGLLQKNGKPVAGVPIQVIQRNRPSHDFLGRFEIGTDSKGRFVLTNLGPNTSYVVYAPMESVAGGIVEPKVVTAGDRKSNTDAGTLTVIPGRRIAGKIVVPKGSAIPEDTRISVASDLSGDSRSVNVRPDGTFAFDAVPAGELRLLPKIRTLTLARFEPEGGTIVRDSVRLPAECDLTDVRLVYEQR